MKNLKLYYELTKPRICYLALLMTALGFFLAKEGPLPKALFFWSLLGTALVGAGCGALNQYLEHEVDGRMERTKNRPLPSGQLKKRNAFWFGAICSVLGVIVLRARVNEMTAFLGLLTLITYLLLYTPLKQKNSLSTLMGAIPGAMPPLMGWTAISGRLTLEGLILFFILFVWQIPHFLAIGWLYREDYAKANFPILNVQDEEGSIISRQIILYSLALVCITFLPWMAGMAAGPIYFFGAFFIGLLFLIQGLILCKKRTRLEARRLFLVSILYLPVLSFLLVLEKL